jgi:response regulator RpfG family c-di-GMP phosphodiesterase
VAQLLPPGVHSPGRLLDDVRNLFALPSVLEAHHMKLVTAENGKEALKLLEQTLG